MDQKSLNQKKIKNPDATISGLYHGAGFLLMWIILRTEIISWFFTPFWDILDQYPGSKSIPYFYFFLIALSIIPATLGGYSIAKIRQAEDIRMYVTSYALTFVFVFALMTSPFILYHMMYWQYFEFYYYPQILTWVFNFSWGFLFGGLLLYLLTRDWVTKLPRKQAILLAAISFGAASLFTNGYQSLYGEFYYWLSALRIVGLGFLGGIGIGSALKADPEKSNHGHFYQRSRYDY